MTSINNDIIEKLSSMSVSDLLLLVKDLELKWGVSAASISQSTPSSSDNSIASSSAEKSSFDLYLLESGSQKISIIKIVREITGLGLKEAKDLVDSCPKILKTSLSIQEANDLKKKIEDLGAKVELK